jgi:hypothetical protein
MAVLQLLHLSPHQNILLRRQRMAATNGGNDAAIVPSNIQALAMTPSMAIDGSESGNFKSVA